MEHSTTLQKLPDGVIFPEHMRDRIRYDAERRRCIFVGFMTKCSYDELIVLSNDLDYRQAVEQLFVLSSEQNDTSTEQASPSLKIVLFAGGSLLAAIVIAWIAFHTFASKEGQMIDVQLTNSVQSK